MLLRVFRIAGFALKMAISLNRVTTKMLKNLTLENVMCPVCRGIFIEPVTMPCQHGLCLQCFERSVEETSFTCPMCRKRIGSWLRTKKKEQNLVNLELWSFIQKRFPQQVQAKLNGDDDGVEQIVCRMETPRISSAGEIREEFHLHLQKLENEVKKKQEAEEKASEELIRKIQEEEEKQLQSMREQLLNQSVEDEKIAKELQDNEAVHGEPSFLHCSQNKQSHATVVKGPMDAFVLSQEKKSFISQQSTSTKADSLLIEDAERARSASVGSTGSHDSIKPEMHHFKPIRSVPRTPPKKLPDGRLLVPKVVRPKTLNLSPVYDSYSRPSNPMQSFRGSSALRMQLARIQADRLRSRSRSSDIVSAFKGRLNRIAQQPTFIFGSQIGERESASEDTESPRKKPRKEFLTEEEEESCAIPSSSSSSEHYCRDEKVVVLVHNPDEGSESQSQDMSNSSRKGDHSSISTDADDTDLEAPEVAQEIGVEAESSNSDVLMASVSDNCKLTATSSASSGFNLKMDQLTLNNRVNDSPKNNHFHTLGTSVKQKGNSNNNNNMITYKSSKDKSRILEDPDAIAMEEVEEQSDPLACLTEEQARIEQMILQEQADLALALRLQEQWDLEARTVDRSKGSLRAYELRNSKPSTRTSASASRKKLTAPIGIGRSRQSTLEESFCLQRTTRR